MRPARSPRDPIQRKRSDAARSASSGSTLQLAGHVDRGEQHVAELVEAVLGRVGRPRARRARLAPTGAGPRRRGSRSRSRRLGAAPCARTAARAGSRAPRRRCPASRPGSRCLIWSQLRRTSAAVSASTSPNTCGWRRISFSVQCSATWARSPAPRSSSSSERKCTWNRTSPSSSSSLASSPRLRRVGELVGLLDGVRDDRALVLLAIPRALLAQPPGDRVEPRRAPVGSPARRSARPLLLRRRARRATSSWWRSAASSSAGGAVWGRAGAVRRGLRRLVALAVGHRVRRAARRLAQPLPSWPGCRRRSGRWSATGPGGSA